MENRVPNLVSARGGYPIALWVPLHEVPTNQANRHSVYEYDSQPAHPSSQSSLIECEEYVLREVPPRLRQILGPELDRDLNIVEERLKRKAIDCVRGLLEEAFHEFRQMNQKSQTQTSNTSGQVGSSHAPSSSDHPALPEAQETDGQPEGGFGEVELSTFSFSMEGMTDFDFNNLFGGSTFLTNPEFSLGEGPIIENLLEPSAEEGEKKLSDSGYESNSPEQTRRDLSES